MCYSAQVCEAYDEYCDIFGADIDIETFSQLYGMKIEDSRIKTPPALDAAFEADQRAEMLNLYHVAMEFGLEESYVYLHQTPMFHAASMGGVGARSPATVTDGASVRSVTLCR